MKKSKFILLFNTLNKREIKDFSHYLKNLYSGQKIAIDVFDYIKSNLPKLLNNTLRKEHILKSQPLKEYKLSSKNFSNTLSDLSLYLEEFLVLKKIKENKHHEKDFHIIELLKERKLDQLYFRKIAETEKKINSTTAISPLTYLNKFKLNHCAFFHTNTKKLDLTIQSLNNGIQNLDSFYFLNKLKYACEMVNRNKILQKKNLMNSQLDFIVQYKKQQDTFSVLYQLYFQIIELLQFGDKEVFLKVKFLFTNNLKSISKEEKGVIIGYLINYIISHFDKDAPNYYAEVFTIYNIALKEDLVVEDGFMSPLSFINIVNAACQVKKFTWNKNFIQTYKKHLASNTQNQVLNIAAAYEAFEKNNFEAVLEYLQFIEFNEHIDFALRSKPLILRSQYELNKKNSSVFDYAKAFEIYIKRNKKINKRSLDGYINFIKYFKVLLRKKINKKLLIEELESSTNVFFKNWLITKTKEL